MDESILDPVEQSTEFVSADTEFVQVNTEYSADALESGVDSIDNSGGDDGSTAVVIDQEQLIDDELGGVPVVLVDDIAPVADYVGTGGSSYQLPEYYVDYFSGVLANMSDTDYVAYAYRDYNGSTYNGYVEHYLLVYDVVVDDGVAVADAYPCIDIYRDSSSSSYVVTNSEYALSTVPAFAYGSYGTYSDLREGVSHDAAWAVLFAIGVATVYVIVTRLFDAVIALRRG